METRPGEEAPLPPPASCREEPSGPALVFAGSNEQDVGLAKTFWDSVTLQPPLESCLAPRRGSLLSDTGPGQGAGGGGGSRRASNDGKRDSARSSISRREEERKQGAIQAEKNAMKEQYLKKAKKREEILALLKKQREERVMKESFANLNKSAKMEESKEQITSSDLEDQERVKALH